MDPLFLSHVSPRVILYWTSWHWVALPRPSCQEGPSQSMFSAVDIAVLVKTNCFRVLPVNK